MKIFTALVGTETNTFSPFVTGWQTFEDTYLIRGGNFGDRPPAHALPLVLWRDRAKALGWTVDESVAAFAMPSGITLRSVYESLREEVLRDLRAAMPVDAVFLNMHGAMVAEGYDDCEGDLASHVRAIVGPDVPIGVELDLHCHVSQNLIDATNAVVLYKEYPHIDIGERADELFTIIADTLAGKVKPHMTLHDCGMIGVFHTSRDPMKSYVAHMKALEGKDGVLSVSLTHSFPWGDVPDLGVRTLVITDNKPELGAKVAADLAERIWAIRKEAQPPYLSMDEALDRAVAHPTGPVVLADVSDNAGGGAPNDSTFLLHRILERGISNAAIGCIWDPIAVSLAMEAGEGTTFDIRVGGKMGPMSGPPADLTVRVGKIARGATQRFGEGVGKLGDAVALHGPNGVDVVVISHRTQTFSPEVFSNTGIDPTSKQILVVKSMQHFYAGFAPIAAEILYVASPGALVPDFKQLPYRKARRDLWPLVEG